MEWFVMRDDCYGVYRPDAEKIVENGVVTYRPYVKVEVRKRTQITLLSLENHFSGRPHQAIGLHPARRSENEGQTRDEVGWGVADIDWHPEGDDENKPPPPEHEETAITWFNAIKARGHDAALETSNGLGGFHVWVLFDPTQPAWVVNAYLRRLTADWKDCGKGSALELFPPNGEVNDYGFWVRLPPRHPTRIEHWSQFYDGTRFVEGDAAIDLFTSLNPIELSEDELADLAGWRVPIVGKVREQPRPNQIMIPESPGEPGVELQSTNPMSEEFPPPFIADEIHAIEALNTICRTLENKEAGYRHKYIVSSSLFLAGMVLRNWLTAKQCIEDMRKAATESGLGPERLHEVDDAWESALSKATPHDDRPGFVTIIEPSPDGPDLPEPPPVVEASPNGQPVSDGQTIPPASSGKPESNTPRASRQHKIGKRRVVLERISDIEERELEWLCPGRIPLASLTMLAGDTKLGKSLKLTHDAACVSTGRPLHGEKTTRDPGSVILLAAEDLIAQTIRPRLRVAGADLSRVHVIRTTITAAGSEVWPSLLTDIEAIEDAAKSLGDVLLIGIDPVTGYLETVNDHRASELRNVLLPLSRMAERLGCAVELVNHVGKAPVMNAKHRVLGSVAYGGTCRANYLFAKDPDDPGRVLMMDNGGNLGAPVPTLAYRIEAKDGHPILTWYEDPVEKTADDVVAAELLAGTHAQQSESVRDIAKAFLQNALKCGPVLEADLKLAADALNLSWRTVKRAKKELGVESKREGFGKEGAWFWKFPTP
jgi:hypothetical protein